MAKRPRNVGRRTVSSLFLSLPFSSLVLALSLVIIIVVWGDRLFRLLAKKNIKEALGGGDRNVHGAPLKVCSEAGMAATGYVRDGFCRREVADSGSHHVCFDIGAGEANFCESTGQPNWCDEKDACQGDEMARCPKRKWCVCQWAFDRALERTPCSEVKVDCDATNIKAFEAYKKDPEKYSRALECLREKCNVRA